MNEHLSLNWRDKTVIRILLIVAKLIGRSNDKLVEEITTLDNHIRAATNP